MLFEMLLAVSACAASLVQFGGPIIDSSRDIQNTTSGLNMNPWQSRLSAVSIADPRWLKHHPFGSIMTNPDMAINTMQIA